LSYVRSSLGAGSHSLLVQAVNKSGAGAPSNASSATIQNQPAPTSWQVTPSFNTCPESSTSNGRFHAGPPPWCDSPGFIAQGDTVTVVCWENRPANYTLWYRITAGANQGTYNSGGWYIAAGTTDMANRPSGMPAC